MRARRRDSKTSGFVTKAYRGFWFCLAPRHLSLSENLRAKEGCMEKTGETSSPLIFLIPMVPCVSSPVTRVSLAFRARLCAERETPEEAAASCLY